MESLGFILIMFSVVLWILCMQSGDTAFAGGQVLALANLQSSTTRN
jgi:hypothetical protein